jgi:hypothetical protein
MLGREDEQITSAGEKVKVMSLLMTAKSSS